VEEVKEENVTGHVTSVAAATEIGESVADYSAQDKFGVSRAEAVSEAQDYADSFIVSTPDRGSSIKADTIDIAEEVAESQAYAKSFVGPTSDRVQEVTSMAEDAVETQAYTDSFAAESAEKLHDAVGVTTGTEDYADSFIIPTPDRIKETKSDADDIAEEVAESQAYTDSFVAPTPERVQDGKGVKDAGADTQAYTDSFVAESADQVDAAKDFATETQDYADSFIVPTPDHAKHVKSDEEDIAEEVAESQAYSDSFVAPSPDRVKDVQDGQRVGPGTKTHRDSVAAESAEKGHHEMCVETETQDYADSFIMPTPDRDHQEKSYAEETADNAAKSQACTDSTAAHALDHGENENVGLVSEARALSHPSTLDGDAAVHIKSDEGESRQSPHGEDDVEESEAVYSDSFVETDAEGDYSGDENGSPKTASAEPAVTPSNEKGGSNMPGTQLLQAPAPAIESDPSEIDEDIPEEDLIGEEISDKTSGLAGPDGIAAVPDRSKPRAGAVGEGGGSSPGVGQASSSGSQSASPDEAEETFGDSDIEAAAAAASSRPQVMPGTSDSQAVITKDGKNPGTNDGTEIGKATGNDTASPAGSSEALPAAVATSLNDMSAASDDMSHAAAAREVVARKVRATADALLMELLLGAVMDEEKTGPVPSDESMPDTDVPNQQLPNHSGTALAAPNSSTTASHPTREEDTTQTPRAAGISELIVSAAPSASAAVSAAAAAAAAAASAEELAEARDYLQGLTDWLPEDAWTGNGPLDELLYVEHERAVNSEVSLTCLVFPADRIIRDYLSLIYYYGIILYYVRIPPSTRV
jgi:hypothetical protein